ncbi:MAG: coniferyl-alcohol dehydrogenase [Boseongicola sp.]|nr:coniferyl-alcohol dehydrogenase [Boseongicola sp.]
MSQTYAVTGVASGIGAKLAATLKSQGHVVVGFDVHEPSENVDHFVPLDLNDKDAITAAAAETPCKLDGLCNNAGVPPRSGLEGVILQVNFLGTRAFTAAMLAHLRAGASIVNMASRAGHGWRDNVEQVKRLAQLTHSDQVARFVATERIDATRCYNLSKEAVILWTAAIAEELLGRGLRANSLSPGGVATGILDDFKRAFGDQMARNVERAGRPGRPEEIAEIAAFVLSPASNWLKGADIAIDGAMGAFNMSDALGLDAMLLPQPEDAE